MKHAVIKTENGNDPLKKDVEAMLSDGQKVYLTESSYTQKELDAFNAEKSKWIIRRAGLRQFTADSDSGEDAKGYYCGYFDLEPENAVFDQGKLTGYYLCPGYMRYSGNGRSTFWMDSWGYPGNDPFKSHYNADETHVFLFADAETHKWKDLTLLKRDPEKEYKSYIDF